VNEPRWLDLRDVLAIQERQIARYGGLHGIRDHGLLESALARPQNLLAYGSPTLVEMAAAYAAGISRNHAFIDGNKRAGFVAAVVFLEYNGYAFTASEAEATQTVLSLAAGELTEQQFAQWLEKNSRPLG
jgi:death-on-curing protein